MLYSATSLIFLLLLASITDVDTSDVTITVESQTDIDCGNELSSDDTCYIACNIKDAKPSNLYCRNAGKCIIQCTNQCCLCNTNIDATNTNHLQFTSTGTSCIDESNIYLPDQGNVTIIGDSLNGASQMVLDNTVIHSGSQTDHIYITCNDRSQTHNTYDCWGMQIDASTANYLEIVINGGEFGGESNQPHIIQCPINSPLSPSCIIDANNAANTKKLQIFADKGMPQDVIFYSNGAGDYSETTITCSSGKSTIKNDNTFIGTPCYITLEPSVSPTETSNPTLRPTTLSESSTSTLATSSTSTSSISSTSSTSSTSSPTNTNDANPSSTEANSITTSRTVITTDIEMHRSTVSNIVKSASTTIDIVVIPANKGKDAISRLLSLSMNQTVVIIVFLVVPCLFMSLCCSLICLLYKYLRIRPKKGREQQKQNQKEQDVASRSTSDASPHIESVLVPKETVVQLQIVPGSNESPHIESVFRKETEVQLQIGSGINEIQITANEVHEIQRPKKHTGEADHGPIGRVNSNACSTVGNSSPVPDDTSSSDSLYDSHDEVLITHK